MLLPAHRGFGDKCWINFTVHNTEVRSRGLCRDCLQVVNNRLQQRDESLSQLDFGGWNLACAVVQKADQHLNADRKRALTPAADLGVVDGEVDPTLVTEASMRG
jgi:hypothetical protein